MIVGKSSILFLQFLQEGYSGLEQENIPVKILLSHDPSHWEAEVLARYSDIDLTLGGDTHGMQPGIECGPVQYFYKQWAGLYQQKDQYLQVNRGFGFLLYLWSRRDSSRTLFSI